MASECEQHRTDMVTPLCVGAGAAPGEEGSPAGIISIIMFHLNRSQIRGDTSV